MSLVIKIADVKLATAVLVFAEALRLNLDKGQNGEPSVYERGTGEWISIGTSKKYDVAGNKDTATYGDYLRKKGITNIITLTIDNFPQAIQAVSEIAVNKYGRKVPAFCTVPSHSTAPAPKPVAAKPVFPAILIAFAKAELVRRKISAKSLYVYLNAKGVAEGTTGLAKAAALAKDGKYYTAAEVLA